MLDLLTAVQKHEGTLEFGVAYKGLNTCTADELEKQIHYQLLDKFPNSKKVNGFSETPNERLMFTCCGKGTCRPSDVTSGTMYPCYTGFLTCNISMKT